MHGHNTKSSKRGQFEISFNWIFVLLIGAAILVFFFAIINRQKDASSEDIANKISARMDSIISVIQQNPDSVQVLKPLSATMAYSCDVDGHTYTVSGGTTRTVMDTELVFTPKTVGDDASLVAWTSVIRVPEPIGTALYLADQKTMYIFIIDPFVSTQEIYAGFPSNYSKMNMTEEDLKNYRDQGFKRYIIVARKDFIPINDLRTIRIASKSSLVEIDNDPMYYTTQYGKIDFYSKVPQSDPDYILPYATKELLYGAIISGDGNLYNCSMRKVMEKIGIVSKLNVLRLDDIRNQFAFGNTCRTLYGPSLAMASLNSMVDHTKYFENESLQFMQEMQKISDYNDELLTEGCPLIY